MNTLEKISHETMVFMRGKYRLDEIGDGKDELKFKQGQKTILTIYIHEDRFTFLLIFGKKSVNPLKCRRIVFQSPYASITTTQKRTMMENGCFLM